MDDDLKEFLRRNLIVFPIRGWHTNNATPEGWKVWSNP